MSEIPINKKIVLQTPQGEYVQPYIETDSSLSLESSNPIQNQAVTTKLNECLRYNVQGSTDPTEPVTLYHSQLQNLDYEHAGHIGFMKDDASNLTSAGQKVFDGQWVIIKNRLANKINYPTTENLIYDLSNILPNDNYNYEVMIMGYMTTGTTVGNEATMEVITDLTGGKSIMVGGKAICVVNGKSSAAGFNCIVPVGIQRQLIMYRLSWVTATFDLWIAGYRRIGTNQ